MGRVTPNTRDRAGMSSPRTDPERFTLFYTSASPFSQHHPSPFILDGKTFACAEQYMMYRKAVMFQDQEMAEKIKSEKCPLKQKQLGRRVRNFNDAEWNERSTEIVKAANRSKFSQNAHLRKLLLETKGTTLVEASPHDRKWGIGLSAKNPKALKRATWRGKNLLGQLLTELREEMLAEDAKKNSDSSLSSE